MPAMKERKGSLDVLLRDRGLSVYALWRQSGVHRDTITKLCMGEGNVRVETVRKIAEALKMEPSELTAILQGDGIVVGTHA